MAGFGATGEFATGEAGPPGAGVVLIQVQDVLATTLQDDILLLFKKLVSLPIARGRVIVVARESRTVIVAPEKRKVPT